jgi:hypothetical protein
MKENTLQKTWVLTGKSLLRYVTRQCTGLSGLMCSAFRGSKDRNSNVHSVVLRH